MKYLCLAYYNPEKFAAMAPTDLQALVSQCPTKDAELKGTGKLIVSASLEGPQAAFALRPRSGRAHVTGGPYAEAKEMVGGFFIIEAADKDEAVRVASLHPAATLGEAVGGVRCIRLGFLSRHWENRFLREGGDSRAFANRRRHGLDSDEGPIRMAFRSGKAALAFGLSCPIYGA